MPSYQRFCEWCGYEADTFEQISAKEKKECPRCKRITFLRLVGTGSQFDLRGGGFYNGGRK